MIIGQPIKIPIVGLNPGQFRFAPTPQAPYAAGQFRCVHGGRCVPVDESAVQATTVLNRELGLRGRDHRIGIDQLALAVINRTVMGGQLPGVRPFHSVADLTRNLLTVLQALSARPTVDFDLGAAGGGAVPPAPRIAKDKVAAFQKALNVAGFKTKVDGGIGPDTVASTNKFLASVGLGPTNADGLRYGFEPLFQMVAKAKPKSLITPPVQAKTPPASMLTRKPITKPGVQPTIDKSAVIALQKALTRSGYPVPATGTLGTLTLKALNNLRAARGRTPALLMGDLIDHFHETVREVNADAAATASKKPIATASLRPQSEVTRSSRPRQVILPRGADAVSDFSCKKGACKPVGKDAAERVVRLQNILNIAPPYLIAQYPKGIPLTVDGVIGPGVVRAVKVVADARGKQKKVAVDIGTLSAESIAHQLDRIIDVMSRALTGPDALKAAPPLPSAQFKILRNGTAVGNPIFRCLAMALQAQLNRLGQRISIDGVIGANTMASVNKTLPPGVRATIQEIAASLDKFATNTREYADRKGAPPPPPAVQKLAMEKCRIEATQPIVDARYFQGQPVTAPTPAPPTTPTPGPQQPLPKPQAAQVAFTANQTRLYNDAVAHGLTPVEAEGTIRNVLVAGGDDETVLQALQRVVDVKEAGEHERIVQTEGRRQAERRRPPSGPTPGGPEGEDGGGGGGGGGEEAAPQAPGPLPPPPPGAYDEPPPEAAPVEPGEPPTDNTWKWVLGGLAGVSALGGVAYLATRPSRRRR